MAPARPRASFSGMRPRVAEILALAAASLLAARPASGQAGPVRVAGTVFDSTAMRPLAGALVQLAPADDPRGRVRSAASDSAGHWAVDSLAPGRYLATFFHARLDSLGVRAGEYLLDAAESVADVLLAGPGTARVVAALCAERMEARPPAAPAAAPAPDAGVLVGRLLDARGGGPRPGAVSAEWYEMVLGAEGLRRERRGSAAAAGDDGQFVLCGLPVDGEAAVRAASGADTLVVVLVVPPNGLVARDLYVGPIAARVAGTVRGDGGIPLAGARVSIAGLPRAAVADSAGAWALDGVPGGTRVLETRAIGYAPDRRVLDVTSALLPPQHVVLASLRSVLDTVRVSARRTPFPIQRFEERRQRFGVGRFLDSAQVRRSGAMRINHLLARTSGFTLVESLTPGGGTVMHLRQRGGDGFEDSCLPALFIDHVRVVLHDMNELDMLVDPSELVAVEIYPTGNAPAEFTTGVGCTTLVLWTNRANTRRRR